MSLSLSERLAQRLGSRIYYGWVIVGVVFVSNLAAFSLNPSFGLFVTSFEEQFGWSRSAITLAPALGTAFGALLAPLLGPLLDRWGPRPLMIFGGLFAAGCYFLLGSIFARWQLYLLYGLLFAVLAIGGGFMVSNVALTRWFRRRRGRAIATVMMGASTGGLLFISIQTFFIDHIGWQWALRAQGGFVLVLVVLPGLLLMVNSPAALGLADHDELRPAGEKQSETSGSEDWSLAEALRTPTLWLVLMGMMLSNLSISGYFVNNVPYMESVGFSRLVAGSAWASFFLVGMFAKLVWGFIVEWVGGRWCLVLLNLGEFLGLYLLLAAPSPTELYFWAAAHGFLHGPWLALNVQIWGDYFGSRSIGRIYGAVQPAIVLAGALGPWLGGYIYDQSGSYLAFYRLLQGLLLLAMILFALAKPPKKSDWPSIQKRT